MAEENSMILTQKIFNNFCETLDSSGYKYKTDGLKINLSIETKDFPINTCIYFDNDIKAVRVVSPLRFKVPEDKNYDCAYMLALVNMSLSDGCFSFDLQSETVYFRTILSYIDGIITKEGINYILDLVLYTVGKFNDKMFLFLQDKMTFEEFADFTMDFGGEGD